MDAASKYSIAFEELPGKFGLHYQNGGEL